MRNSLYLWLLFFAGSVSPVAADVRVNTNYQYYSVSGGTAGAMHRSMLAAGPNVRGADAYGATVVTYSPQVRQNGKSCRVVGQRFDFNIRIPRVSGSGGPKDGSGGAWRQFASLVKRHEETHRSIWLACTGSLVNQVRAIHASSCQQAKQQALSLWNATRGTCQSKHAAFDRSERKRLINHPFLRVVSGNRNK
jgi:predicted secreted Zn-dependent protease